LGNESATSAASPAGISRVDVVQAGGFRFQFVTCLTPIRNLRLPFSRGLWQAQGLNQLARGPVPSLAPAASNVFNDA
jgi:hypothetical protein